MGLAADQYLRAAWLRAAGLDSADMAANVAASVLKCKPRHSFRSRLDQCTRDQQSTMGKGDRSKVFSSGKAAEALAARGGGGGFGG